MEQKEGPSHRKPCNVKYHRQLQVNVYVTARSGTFLIVKYLSNEEEFSLTELVMATGNEDHETSPTVRLKRRQSDARWRANVATCFETLKHVIPMNLRATKRQISKVKQLLFNFSILA